MDLEMMGRELRARRRAQHFRSVDLANQLGVSQTYVWLVEMAKPRANGIPSQPRRDLLLRWTHELGLDSDETQRIVQLAGYAEPEGVSEPPERNHRDEMEHVLADRLRRVLRTADRRERTEEATTLLESYLRWLQVHIDRDP
jgi:transcriptional regulator with XRE-family HTH domain